MPTGYTGMAFEAKMDFKQFALLCARAMGFCIMLRDDSLDTPLPEAFTPSPYYADVLAKAEALLAEWETMTPLQQTDFVLRGRDSSIESLQNSWKKTAQENDYYLGLREQTEKWDVPEELAGMKAFMVEQLTVSLTSEDYFANAISSLSAKSATDLLNEHEEHLRRHVAYCRKELTEEIGRVDGRNRYLSLLRESLNALTTTTPTPEGE